ncbi:hypothetical protein [Motilimonas pumila]|uniref:DUF2157 domain-containing protein n=1 Tax=Motilimonas pumila TaxID=2303987 RepID=A0A418Y9Q8_9GAMM|nr:hypothetical protein [Motilimonas pumila]RJG38171.1 hypothetical protein D1Z90_19285 [Motilimonas pumila]
MYQEEDLKQAVQQGIFSADAVAEFKQLVASRRGTPQADEESFKLIGGFNDIFIVITCAILLSCSYWIMADNNQHLAWTLVSLLSWGLAEFFVRKRKMALPAIFLLLVFVGSLIAHSLVWMPLDEKNTWVLATGVAALGAALHWWRFRVPITIAAGTAASVLFVLASIVSAWPQLIEHAMPMLFTCGVVIFAFALCWDRADTAREDYQSDVAFWLHLMAAPLIIHPVFSHLGILMGEDNFYSTIWIVALYVVMTLVSLVIDRRAFMLSSLVYVIYAITNIVEVMGGIASSLALTGVVVGSVLLLLSAFWQQARASLLNILPQGITRNVPAAQAD